MASFLCVCFWQMKWHAWLGDVFFVWCCLFLRSGNYTAFMARLAMNWTRGKQKCSCPCMAIVKRKYMAHFLSFSHTAGHWNRNIERKFIFILVLFFSVRMYKRPNDLFHQRCLLWRYGCPRAFIIWHLISREHIFNFRCVLPGTLRANIYCKNEQRVVCVSQNNTNLWSIFSEKSETFWLFELLKLKLA